MAHDPDILTFLFRLPESWFNQHLTDGGPLYAEYNPEQFIVEPWNALSSVFMIFPALFWLWYLRRERLNSWFLFFSVALVFFGGLGSTLFHAFRLSPVFLMLDVIPSAILTIAIAIYLWLKVLKKRWYIVLIFIPVFTIRFLLSRTLPAHIGTNVSYVFSGLLILVPLLIELYRSNFLKWFSVVMVLFSFGVAILFRQLDTHHWHYLPQGTHFLWHLFSAVGSYYMLDYLVSNMNFSRNKKAGTIQ